MIDVRDLKLIGEEVGRVIDDNLMPRIEDLIATELTPIKATMVTKSYLDDKMADLKSDLVEYDRKLEKKTDVLVEALAERTVLDAANLECLERARVFRRGN